MNIQCRVVGMPDRPQSPKWPADWPLPQVGETVNLSGDGVVWVRGIDWFPEGLSEGFEPCVIVVLGPKPR